MITRNGKEFPPRWLTFVCILALLIGVGVLVWDKWTATQDKNTAQANSQTLAQEIQRMCAEQGALVVDDRDLCAKATQVQEKPTEALPGPKGDKGEPGKDGEPGRDSTVPGPPGRDGKDGADSTVPGPPGKDGKDGADSTVPGPQGVQGVPGADSTVPGPAGPAGPAGADGATGPAGPQGEPGRGIASAYCGDNDRWTITYTDGAVQDGGQCRESKPPLIK